MVLVDGAIQAGLGAARDLGLYTNLFFVLRGLELPSHNDFCRVRFEFEFSRNFNTNEYASVEKINKLFFTVS